MAVDKAEEQTPIITAWDMREAAYKRLWRPYLSESELPTEYPRSNFDEQTLTDQLEEEARKIMHSVPADVARRIVQTVAQRLGVQA